MATRNKKWISHSLFWSHLHFGFNFLNGLNDSSNIVATVITSRAMPPRAGFDFNCFWRIFGAICVWGSSGQHGGERIARPFSNHSTSDDCGIDWCHHLEYHRPTFRDSLLLLPCLDGWLARSRNLWPTGSKW